MKAAVFCMAAFLCLIPASSFAQEENTNDFVGNGNGIYSVLKITGDLMPEESVFSVSDLMEIVGSEETELEMSEEYKIGQESVTAEGLNAAAFLSMCGLRENPPEEATVSFFADSITEPELTLRLAELGEGGCNVLISVPCGETALSDKVSAVNGQSEAYPAVFVKGTNRDDIVFYGLKKIVVNSSADSSDPYYGLHLREPLKYMQDIEFTINFIDKNIYVQKDDNAEPFKTVTYTMKEIEDMYIEHPDWVYGNYFGISGDEDTKTRLGLGGFSDYYEGISMSSLLCGSAGLKDGEGSAVFYGRDNDEFAVVSDISYFFPENDDYSKYYLELNNSESVSGVVPIIGISKNGYPLLPEHDHEMEGNVDYNTFNKNANEAGFDTRLGLVKNVSGPFIAGLANLDGIYGGYRNETNGDCIRIDLYVDASDYVQQSDQLNVTFEDVPRDSWYGEYVYYLSDRGIAEGSLTGMFEPQKNITRAEFIKLLAGIAGVGEPNNAQTATCFKDVAQTAWYAPYVSWAYNENIINGGNTELFMPDDNITRQDIAVIIYRYGQQKGIGFSNTQQFIFSDLENISGYAREAAVALYDAGIISGRSENMFAPKENATRAEACKILTLIDELVGE